METIGDTRVRLHPLSFVGEGDEVVIGRLETESYAVFPADAAEVVRKLESGATVRQAAAWYESAYGEPADVEDLVETLRSLHFVRDAADEGVWVQEPLRLTRLARALFSVPAWIGYGLITAGGVYAMVRVPGLRPAASHAFFTPSLVIVLLGLLFAQLPGIAWHESYHVMAGRRLGLSAKVAISRRLYFLVFQTTVPGLMSVSRAKRILPICAGLVADCLYFNAMVLIAALDRHLNGSLDVGGRLALAVAFVTLIRMAWQFLIYMETDVYHLFATLFRCPDLHRMTREHIGAGFRRVLRRPARAGTRDTWSEHDRAMVRRYAPLVLAGSALALAGMLAATVPMFTGIVVRLVQALATGDPLTAGFWNAVAVAAGSIVELGIVVGMLLHGRRARRKRAAAAAADGPSGPG